jgi:autotransporter translocation and assembly factor TamB
MMKLIRDAVIHTVIRFTVIVMLGVIALVCFIGETSSGLQLVIQFVAPMVPGKLRIEKAEGALFSAFTLQQITWQYQNATTTVDKLQLHWSLAALQQHQIHIEQLTLDRVRVHTEASTAPHTHNMPALAFLEQLTADQVDINELVITHAEHAPFNFTSLHLQKRQPDVITFALHTLDGELRGKVAYHTAPAFTWSLTLAGLHLNPGRYWQEWPGNVNFTSTTNGSLPSASQPNLTLSLQTSNSTLRQVPLSGNLSLQLAQQRLRINAANLRIADASATLSGSVADNWDVRWQIQVPRLGTVLPDSQGTLASQGHMTGSQLAPHIQATLQAAQLVVNTQKIQRLNATLDLTKQQQTPATLRLDATNLDIANHHVKKIALTLTGHVAANQDNWVTHADVAIAGQRYIRVLLTLPNTFDFNAYATQPLTAIVNVNFPNLSTLKDTLPDITNPQGILQGSLQIQGSLAQPAINGQIKLTGGNLTLPKLNITLQNITFDITGNQTRRLTYTGSFQSGDGRATLRGTTDFSQATFPTEISLKGTHLQAINLPEYKIWVSPALTLHLTKTNLYIDGDLSIPKAEIDQKDFRQTIALPDDVVFVGAKEKPALNLLTAMPTMRIAVHIENNIPLHYQDLKTTVSGNLTISTSPTSFATATGELYTNGGTYHAYGQNLEITEGRFIFRGGFINNPSLNMKAVRRINTVVSGSASSFTTSHLYSGTQVLTVGMRIVGTLDKPVISLFADPAGLSQDEILSYLVLGIPRSQVSIKDSASLLNASSALNLTGGAPQTLSAITTKLQTGLGLTELDVAPVQTFDPTLNKNTGGAVSATSLVLGKQIANRLYVHYSVSLFSATPITILNVRYQLSKRWSVQSETSTIDNGADFLYTLESN